MAVEQDTLAVPAHEHEDHPGHKKLVIITWGGELDRVWPQMILATTGAAMDMDTTVFFTFWGLMALVKDNKRITGDNWMQKMMAMMDRPGIDHLKLGQMNFVGAGPAMMKKLAQDHSVASPGELLQMAVDLGRSDYFNNISFPPASLGLSWSRYTNVLPAAYNRPLVGHADIFRFSRLKYDLHIQHGRRRLILRRRYRTSHMLPRLMDGRAHRNSSPL